MSGDHYYLTFVVNSKKTNNHSLLRIFHSNSLIDEIPIHSAYQKIDVPIEYQDDIGFKCIGDNECRFDFVVMTKKYQVDDENQCVRPFFLYTNTILDDEYSRGDHISFLNYKGSHIGHNIVGKKIYDGKILHYQSKLRFADKKEAPTDYPHFNFHGQDYDKFWINDRDGKTYSKMPASWIAKFRPGFACFFRKYIDYHQGIPTLNIYDDIMFDLGNQTVKLTNAQGRTINVPSDKFYGFKKVSKEVEYMNFVYNSIILYPAIALHWNDFRP